MWHHVILIRTTRRHIVEDGIHHSHGRLNLISYIEVTGWALYKRRNVSRVRYELGFYIPEDSIHYSYGRENLKFYAELTNWAL
jgi:hypothetical protein